MPLTTEPKQGPGLLKTFNTCSPWNPAAWIYRDVEIWEEDMGLSEYSRRTMMGVTVMSYLERGSGC